MRSIIIKKIDGEVLEVTGLPDDAKITYCRYSSTSIALRIYRGSKATKGNQIAVFRGVEEFYDKSLIIVTKGTVDWVTPHTGGFQ